jgi:glycosyltransferase involved in cell wall biosynthesis
MVVTDVGGLAETVPNGVVGYVTSKKEEDIAAALIDFYEQQREETFSKNAEAHKAVFSWENICNALIEVSN